MAGEMCTIYPSVKAKKTKCIEALVGIHSVTSKSNDMQLVDDWIAAVEAEEHKEQSEGAEQE